MKTFYFVDDSADSDSDMEKVCKKKLLKLNNYFVNKSNSNG